jgi:hypothetical protein
MQLYNITKDKSEKRKLSDKVLQYAHSEFSLQKTIDMWHESMILAINEFKNRKKWSTQTF